MDKESIVVSTINKDDLFLKKKDLNKNGYIWNDVTDENVSELEEIYKYSDQKISEQIINKERTVIVEYPWSKNAVRLLEQKYFLELCFSRNRNLISTEEQAVIYDKKIAIAGLSVGSNICKTMAMQGVGNKFNIADSDTLSSTNLNRLNESIVDIGKSKAILLGRRLAERNPFLGIKVFEEGISEENIGEFTAGASIIFDEIDDLRLKLLLRDHAKRSKTPLIMITDNGDNVMVDIERYDLKNNLMPFHGLLSDKELSIIRKAKRGLGPKERVRLSLKIVKPYNAVPRMQDSLTMVGETLNTWPQLGTAATLAGSVGCYITRKIILGEAIVSGRHHISIDSMLIPKHRSVKSKISRLNKTVGFVRKMSKAKS